MINFIRYGYDILSNASPSSLKTTKEAIQTYFARSSDYKRQFTSYQYPELGYRDLQYKEIVMIRDDKVPRELLACIPLAEELHQMGLLCLQKIAVELSIDAAHLLSLVEARAFPAKELSPSLLRLVNYHDASTAHPGAVACNMHQDLGLLTIVCYTGIPALQVYNLLGEGEWETIEERQKESDLIIMAGESLSLISNNYIIPANHRVRKSRQKRLAIVYQLRLKPNAILNSQDFESPVIGHFPQSFTIVAEDFLAKEINARQSVNGSY